MREEFYKQGRTPRWAEHLMTTHTYTHGCHTYAHHHMCHMLTSHTYSHSHSLIHTHPQAPMGKAHTLCQLSCGGSVVQPPGSWEARNGPVWEEGSARVARKGAESVLARAWRASSMTGTGALGACRDPCGLGFGHCSREGSSPCVGAGWGTCDAS